MKRMLAAVAGASLLLVLGGCGDDDDKVDSLGAAGAPTGDAAGAAGGTSLAGSADADRPDADLGDAAQNGGGEEGVPESVEPRAGMDNVRPVTWDKAEVLSPRNLRITFYGGVEPCDVLDSVKVNYGAKNVTVSLFSGSDPAKPDAVCIEIAKLKAVEVQLTEDLNDRKVVDGAPDARSDGGTAAGSATSVDTGAGAPAGKIRGDAPAVALTPKAGQANVQQITWDKVEMLDGNIARVYFTTGVEPCSVLDSVKVIYAKEIIRIALFTGSDPAQKDAACPALARFAYTDVKLKEPVGHREVVDDYQTD